MHFISSTMESIDPHSLSTIHYQCTTDLGLLEASGAVFVDDGQLAGLAEVSGRLLAHVDERADHPHVPCLDRVVRLHCADLTDERRMHTDVNIYTTVHVIVLYIVLCIHTSCISYTYTLYIHTYTIHTLPVRCAGRTWGSSRPGRPGAAPAPACCTCAFWGRV